ncbi:MAG: signal recognition particle-docking protein FtsY [Methanobacteriota archaeon]|nr:MAG: signal recognition particle-docking protein FtsY [Euryarchaeota archaeon]PXY77309.1 MAG: signal recognition particle-docking protein FtsY [Euryarchaeota archaeon]
MMGLFDRFRKRIHEVAAETDESDLIAAEDSVEAQVALAAAAQLHDQQPTDLTEAAVATEAEDTTGTDADEWDDFEDPEDLAEAAQDTTSATVDTSAISADGDDWDEWDDDDDDATPLPVTISKKERKRLKKESRRQEEIKAKNHPSSQTKPKGSRVNLQMMRSTTGRQLVKVEAAPRGSSGTKHTDDEFGKSIEIDLGGGVVESGGKVIKQGAAFDKLMDELEWLLLESDISSLATTAVMGALRRELLGNRLRKGAKLEKVLEASLKRALQTILKSDYWDFNATVDEMVKNGDTPVIIMLVGVNGTGKTTTVAKIAHRMKQQGHTVIAAAADTFRAGAIEQLELHCTRLGIRCISSQRGGDSAAIARDAVESGRARGAHVVLIDTAGRMQNKINLMAELEKVHRVIKPHLVLFIGDALAGNDAVDQAVEFQKMLAFDGAVLTKLDTDAKGGAALSIAHATGRPIVMAGIGQGYDDLIQFVPNWLLDQLFA